MEKAKRFEDLWVWQQARILVSEIYADFRQVRDYGFKDQVQRAGISIMNNTAEGFERGSNKDFGRFLDIAKGSCGEVRSLYYAAEDLVYVNAEIADNRRLGAKKISSGLSSLAGYVRSA